MTISNSILGKKELYSALIKARSEFPDLIKNNEVTFKVGEKPRYKFEDLPGVYDIILPVLKDNNLYLDPICDVIVSEHLKETGYLVVLKLRLCHSLSEQCTDWSTYPVVVHKEDVNFSGANALRQSEAGLNTFLRRYHIKYLLNLCGENDDKDGDSTKGNESISIIKNSSARSEFISAAQLGKLKAMIGSNKEREANMCKYYAIQSLSQLPWKQMNDAVAILEHHAAKDKQPVADQDMNDMIF